MSGGIVIPFKPKMSADITLSPFDDNPLQKKYLLRQGERNFSISSDTRDAILCMDGSRTLDMISGEMNTALNSHYTAQQLENLVAKFLVPNGLLENGDAATVREGKETNPEPKKRKYLRFKAKLFSAETILHFSNRGKWLFHRAFVYPVILLFLIAGYFCFAIKPFELEFVNRIGPSEWLLVYAIFVVSILFHELGHASAARYVDIRHNDIGVGLYLVFIVFFTDLSYAWSLRRTERLVINFGGMYFQIVFALLLEILFIVLRVDFIYYALLCIIIAIISSLNPFVRFDGYWILSDFLGISNLSQRVKEFLRYVVFGRLTGRQTNPVLSIRKKERYIFYVYFLVTTLILGYFFLYILLRSPSVIIDGVSRLGTLYAQLISANGSIPGILIQMINQLFTLGILIFLIVDGIILNLRKAVRYLYNRKVSKGYSMNGEISSHV